MITIARWSVNGPACENPEFHRAGGQLASRASSASLFSASDSLRTAPFLLLQNNPIPAKSAAPSRLPPAPPRKPRRGLRPRPIPNAPWLAAPRFRGPFSWDRRLVFAEHTSRPPRPGWPGQPDTPHSGGLRRALAASGAACRRAAPLWNARARRVPNPFAGPASRCRQTAPILAGDPARLTAAYELLPPNRNPPRSSSSYPDSCKCARSGFSRPRFDSGMSMTRLTCPCCSLSNR